MQGRDKDQMNHRPWLIGLGALLAALFLTLLLLTGWAQAATVTYPVQIGATDYTAYKYQVVVDTVTVAGTWVTRATSMPTSVINLSLDNAKQNQVKVWYAFGSDTVVSDLFVDLKRARTTLLTERTLQSTGADTCYFTVYSGASSFSESYVDTFTSDDAEFPQEVQVALSSGQMHMIREKWHFAGETNGEYSISQYHPVILDTLQVDTVGTTITPPESTNVCGVWGYVRTPWGLNQSNVQVKAQTEALCHNQCDSSFVAARTYLTRSDANGQFQLDLNWSSCLVTDDSTEVRWRIWIAGEDMGLLKVPDSTTYRLPENTANWPQ